MYYPSLKLIYRGLGRRFGLVAKSSGVGVRQPNTNLSPANHQLCDLSANY